ncbi:MAG: MBL fold metallo-hydrolase [Deltaproteobacteria bacterium]|nr:MBL fold metallo-hydrolase [Deltaproteobacteria bacterium]
MVLRQMQVGPMAVFAYLVGDEETGEGLAVDPASRADDIVAEAEKYGISIKYIVNTHGHSDHTGGNADMKSRTGAKIIIHEDDALMLGAASPVMLLMCHAKQSPIADRTVRDGDCINVGSISLRVIHVPGHTPGGIALYVPGYVITGDTLFVEAVGRTDLPGGSWEVMRDSIRSRLFVLPDETVVLPGHNYGREERSTIGNEKRNNPFLQE